MSRPGVRAAGELGGAFSGELARALAGEPVDRRTMLFLAAGSALGIPAALPACGQVVPGDLTDRVHYYIGPILERPPIGDLARLIALRASALGMGPHMSVAEWSASDLRTSTELAVVFDPRTNRFPPLNNLIVVGALDPAVVEAIATTAIRRGIRIVSYPVALQHQSAAIIADAAQAATMLATHAAAWASTRRRRHAGVLLVLPPASEAPLYVAQAPGIEQAVRGVLAHAAPGVALIATTQASGQSAASSAVGRALASHPGVRMVLVWDDDTAIGAAQALRRYHAGGPREDLYAGALGAPAVTSRATFAELERDDVLRVVIAARPRELANAMVDLPRALLRGAPARNVELALHTLAPRSAALAGYSQDYSQPPPAVPLTGVLNPGA